MSFKLNNNILCVLCGVGMIFTLSGCKGDNHNNYNYQITSPDFSWHYTNTYIQKNNCIDFIDNFDENFIFCGTYQIKILKNTTNDLNKSK